MSVGVGAPAAAQTFATVAAAAVAVSMHTSWVPVLPRDTRRTADGTHVTPEPKHPLLEYQLSKAAWGSDAAREPAREPQPGRVRKERQKRANVHQIVELAV